MDFIALGTGFTFRNCWFIKLWQIGARPSLLNWFLYARGVSRRWPLQEGGLYRRPKLSTIDTGRGRSARDAGKQTILIQHDIIENNIINIIVIFCSTIALRCSQFRVFLFLIQSFNPTRFSHSLDRLSRIICCHFLNSKSQINECRNVCLLV